MLHLKYQCKDGKKSCYSPSWIRYVLFSCDNCPSFSARLNQREVLFWATRGIVSIKSIYKLALDVVNPLPADSFSKYKTKVTPNKVCIIRLYTIKYCIFRVI